MLLPCQAAGFGMNCKGRGIKQDVGEGFHPFQGSRNGQSVFYSLRKFAYNIFDCRCKPTDSHVLRRLKTNPNQFFHRPLGSGAGSLCPFFDSIPIPKRPLGSGLSGLGASALKPQPSPAVLAGKPAPWSV
jgi:hypothetical protein